MMCVECGRFIDDRIKGKTDGICSLCEEFIEKDKEMIEEYNKLLDKINEN